MAYFYLAFVIIAEVVGTSALKAAEGCTRPLPVLIVALGVRGRLLLREPDLEEHPPGADHGAGSGLGIVLIPRSYGQAPDVPALLRMALIVLGGAVLFRFSEVRVR